MSTVARVLVSPVRVTVTVMAAQSSAMGKAAELNWKVEVVGAGVGVARVSVSA